MSKRVSIFSLFCIILASLLGLICTWGELEAALVTKLLGTSVVLGLTAIGSFFVALVLPKERLK
jgi:hypothetical protein